MQQLWAERLSWEHPAWASYVPPSPDTLVAFVPCGVGRC